MKLLIAIPALNEEASIENIILRSLAARESICRRAGIDAVEITVVSDGSTDRTAEIAGRFTPQIGLIIFSKNRGYGAAIKEAWRKSDAQLLGFLDADGTCDPEFFGDLCRAVIEKDAGMALGSRIHAKSKMLLIRRVGNRFFALLLSLFSETRVSDTASGMRVIRRSVLPQLMPLPDGLHFTPAMSARAILSGGMRLVEINMPYKERQGESKLHVWKDGLRFLKVIVQTAFLYCPARVLNLIATACFAYGFFLMVIPSVFYLNNQKLEEWMIYRFLVGSLTGIAACLFFCAAHTARRIVTMTLKGGVSLRNRGFFASKWFWAVPGFLILSGGALVFHSFAELILTGHTQEHWSRFVVMSLFYSLALILSVTRGIDYLLDLVQIRMAYLKRAEAQESSISS